MSEQAGELEATVSEAVPPGPRQRVRHVNGDHLDGRLGPRVAVEAGAPRRAVPERDAGDGSGVPQPEPAAHGLADRIEGMVFEMGGDHVCRGPIQLLGRDDVRVDLLEDVGQRRRVDVGPP